MISVIIPMYKSENTIDQAVNSVLNQTEQDFEIILVDDGGTMDPSKFKFQDKKDRISYYAVKHGGVAAARNYGIEKAKGEYVAFLDSDDWWQDKKLAKELKYMKEYRVDGEAPKIVFSGRALYTADGSPMEKRIGCQRVVTYGRLLRSNQINCSSVMMRREDALRHPFPVVEKAFHEDYAVWLEVLREGGYAAGINRPLLCYRMDKNSKSGNKLKSALMTYRVYQYVGIHPLRRITLMISYAIKGFLKYK